MIYSKKFKDRMIQRMAGPFGVSASSLSEEVGVPQTTLSRWLRVSVERMSEQEDVQRNSPPSPKQERSPLEKAALVFEANKLEGEQLGAFLRRNGLHEAQLQQLRRWVANKLAPAEEREEKAAARLQQKRIKKLERELQRKEKALAEAAALLVLQKKVQSIWGDEDEDIDTSNES